MDALLSFLQTAGLILLVIVFFNIMIFVHELGHFWAGRWRGAYIDRFQIWFGKPIWKKKINGVEWGLGWIPAGGFVSLPQMGDMEAIEGDAPEEAKKLKPLKPLDKIIIAAAGPLFSLLLACFFAVFVWMAGKPTIEIDTTVGYVIPDSPAAVAGILPGDRVLSVDGEPVTEWVGDMKGVSEAIALSENETISLKIERSMPDGSTKTLDIVTDYELPESQWWQRTGMRRVGIMPSFSAIIGDITPGSPADKAGLKSGYRIVAVNKQPIYSPQAIMDMCKDGVPMELRLQQVVQGIEAEGIEIVTITPEVPVNWKEKEGARPLMGFSWADEESVAELDHPTPWAQVTQSLRWMKQTLEKVISPGSDVGVQHLSGPVGIGTHIYNMLTSPDGWRFVLWFAVILNVNLAVLNMLPLPVVDGGHVVLGFVEMIVGRPVGGTILNWIQLGFVFLMMGFFIFVTMKDVGDSIGGEDEMPQLPDPIFSK